MVAREDIRQRILVFVDVLKLIYHDVFQPLLPFLPDLPAVVQNVQGEINQIVKIQRKALALLIEIAVENFVLQGGCALGQLQKMVHIGINEGLDIPPAALAPADVINGLLNGDVPARNAKILENRGQYGLFVLLVHDEECLRVAHHMAVLFEKGDAEAVEGGDPGKVLIRQLAADTLFHLRGGLIGEGDAEDIGRGDAQHIHEIEITGGQGLGLPGACPGHYPDIPLRGGGGLPLGGVQLR